MKYLFIIFISLSVHAEFYGAITDIQNCSNDSGVDLFSDIGNCQNTKGSECIAYPGGNCQHYELIDNLVLDFIRKEKAVTCIDEDDCLKKESEQICDLGKIIHTETEVYCAVEAYKKDGVKLVESEAKKAAKAAADKAREDAEKVKADKKKAFKFKGKTIAEIRDELNEFLDSNK